MPFEITSRSCIGRSFERLIKTLAATPEIQSFLGVGSAAAAETRIHLFETPASADPTSDEYTPDEWTALHPMLVVSPPESGNMFEAISIATGGAFAQSFIVEVKFCRLIPDSTAGSQSELNLELLDIIGVAYEEMKANQGQGNYFWFTDVVLDKPIWRAPIRDRTNIGDRQIGWLTLAAAEEAA